eukprot:g4744.t1
MKSSVLGFVSTLLLIMHGGQLLQQSEAAPGPAKPDEDMGSSGSAALVAQQVAAEAADERTAAVHVGTGKDVQIVSHLDPYHHSLEAENLALAERKNVPGVARIFHTKSKSKSPSEKEELGCEGSAVVGGGDVRVAEMNVEAEEQQSPPAAGAEEVPGNKIPDEPQRYPGTSSSRDESLRQMAQNNEFVFRFASEPARLFVVQKSSCYSDPLSSLEDWLQSREQDCGFDSYREGGRSCSSRPTPTDGGGGATPRSSSCSPTPRRSVGGFRAAGAPGRGSYCYASEGEESSGATSTTARGTLPGRFSHQRWGASVSRRPTVDDISPSQEDWWSRQTSDQQESPGMWSSDADTPTLPPSHLASPSQKFQLSQKEGVWGAQAATPSRGMKLVPFGKSGGRPPAAVATDESRVGGRSPKLLEASASPPDAESTYFGLGDVESLPPAAVSGGDATDPFGPSLWNLEDSSLNVFGPRLSSTGGLRRSMGSQSLLALGQAEGSFGDAVFVGSRMGARTAGEMDNMGMGPDPAPATFAEQNTLMRRVPGHTGAFSEYSRSSRRCPDRAEPSSSSGDDEEDGEDEHEDRAGTEENIFEQAYFSALAQGQGDAAIDRRYNRETPEVGPRTGLNENPELVAIAGDQHFASTESSGSGSSAASGGTARPRGEGSLSDDQRSGSGTRTQSHISIVSASSPSTGEAAEGDTGDNTSSTRARTISSELVLVGDGERSQGGGESASSLSSSRDVVTEDDLHCHNGTGAAGSSCPTPSCGLPPGQVSPPPQTETISEPAGSSTGHQRAEDLNANQQRAAETQSGGSGGVSPALRIALDTLEKRREEAGAGATSSRKEEEHQPEDRRTAVEEEDGARAGNKSSGGSAAAAGLAQVDSVTLGGAVMASLPALLNNFLRSRLHLLSDAEVDGDEGDGEEQYSDEDVVEAEPEGPRIFRFGLNDEQLNHPRLTEEFLQEMQAMNALEEQREAARERERTKLRKKAERAEQRARRQLAKQLSSSLSVSTVGQLLKTLLAAVQKKLIAQVLEKQHTCFPAAETVIKNSLCRAASSCGQLVERAMGGVGGGVGAGGHITLPVIRKLLVTLDSLHTDAELCHNDLSLDGIQIDAKGNPILVSLGRARRIRSLHAWQSLESSRGLREGRARYTAPEKLRKHGHYDEKVDVWAFAMLVHEWTLAGRHGKGPLYSIFTDTSEQAIVKQLREYAYSTPVDQEGAHTTISEDSSALSHRLEEIELLIQLNEPLYHPIWRFLRTLLVKDPRNRPSFEQALATFDVMFPLTITSSFFTAAPRGRLFTTAEFDETYIDETASIISSAITAATFGGSTAQCQQRDAASSTGAGGGGGTETDIADLGDFKGLEGIDWRAALSGDTGVLASIVGLMVEESQRILYRMLAERRRSTESINQSTKDQESGTGPMLNQEAATSGSLLEA